MIPVFRNRIQVKKAADLSFSRFFASPFLISGSGSFYFQNLFHS